jgi:hypothetical protein
LPNATGLPAASAAVACPTFAALISPSTIRMASCVGPGPSDLVSSLRPSRSSTRNHVGCVPYTTAAAPEISFRVTQHEATSSAAKVVPKIA